MAIFEITFRWPHSSEMNYVKMTSTRFKIIKIEKFHSKIGLKFIENNFPFTQWILSKICFEKIEKISQILPNETYNSKKKELNHDTQMCYVPKSGQFWWLRFLVVVSMWTTMFRGNDSCCLCVVRLGRERVYDRGLIVSLVIEQAFITFHTVEPISKSQTLVSAMFRSALNNVFPYYVMLVPNNIHFLLYEQL